MAPFSIVTVYPFEIVIGAAEKPFENSTPPLAVGPMVKFSAMVVPLVLIILFSPTDGPPPPTLAQPGEPDTSCFQFFHQNK